jgi:hypothetical protein
VHAIIVTTRERGRFILLLKCYEQNNIFPVVCVAKIETSQLPIVLKKFAFYTSHHVGKGTLLLP